MFRQSSLALRFTSTTTVQASHISTGSYALDRQDQNLVRTWYQGFKDNQIDRKYGKVTKTPSGTVTLHYPLDALFSQIPVQLRPKIENSKYHKQKDELTILIKGDSSPREKEMMAWEALVTMIHSASLASRRPGHTGKRFISREIKDKVASLEKVEREHRLQNAKFKTDEEKARIATLAQKSVTKREFAKHSHDWAPGKNFKR